ncbi:hypothetical protein BVY03_02555 [bacterium K02(2017)]|nr:hypothetical protein BVY03_02555 [bacterium K02(2017)]
MGEIKRNPISLPYPTPEEWSCLAQGVNPGREEEKPNFSPSPHSEGVELPSPGCKPWERKRETQFLSHIPLRRSGAA